MLEVCKDCQSTGFTKENGTDFEGGVINSVEGLPFQEMSFDNCVELCKSTSGCMAVQMNEDGCYLKYAASPVKYFASGMGGRRCYLAPECSTTMQSTGMH